MKDAPQDIQPAGRPVAYRVWWEHHSAKLTTSKPPSQEFREFRSMEEAVAFKQSQRKAFPHSAFCIEPVYLTGTRRKRGLRRRSQR